ncbi:MAG: AsmA family protein, partial [Telmatospirillum sp.]|nr:AsmA family protein [Telmatospirillum sp.]
MRKEAMLRDLTHASVCAVSFALRRRAALHCRHHLTRAVGGTVTRKGISALGGALFVVLAVLLATPALIDWNGYRDSLARQLGHALGRPVVIEGALTLSLVPTPIFTAGKVRLADGGSDDLGLSISGVDLQPALLSLLQGRLEIASLRLHAPEMRVGRLPPAGRSRSPVPSISSSSSPSPSPSPSPPSAAPAAGPAGEARAPALPSLRTIAPRSVASVIIDNGTLVYAPAGRAPFRLEAIGASLTTSGTGGTRLVGTARVGSAEVSFDALEGSDAADTPVSLSLSTAEGSGLLRFGGQASGTGPDRRIKGKLTVKASDPGRVARSLGLGAVTFPAGNLSLEATATVMAREVDLDSLLVSLAGADGQGNASVIFADRPQIDVKLAFGRLDLDALLAAGFPAETGAPRPARPAPPP